MEELMQIVPIVSFRPLYFHPEERDNNSVESRPKSFTAGDLPRKPMSCGTFTYFPFSLLISLFNNFECPRHATAQITQKHHRNY